MLAGGIRGRYYRPEVVLEVRVARQLKRGQGTKREVLAHELAPEALREKVSTGDSRIRSLCPDLCIDVLAASTSSPRDII